MNGWYWFRYVLYAVAGILNTLMFLTLVMVPEAELERSGQIVNTAFTAGVMWFWFNQHSKRAP